MRCPDLLRERLDRQIFHEALEEVWKVIRAANGYIDRQAPWALQQDRQGAHGHGAAGAGRCAAGDRHGAAAVHAGQHGADAGSARRAARRATLRRIWRRRWPTGLRCRRRRGCFPRYVEPVRLMLIDSHCHLDYFTAAELPEVLARAAAAGVGEMVTIGTTLAQSERLPPMTEAHRESVVHRRGASAPRRRGADPDAGNPGRDDAASARHRHRRIRAWTISTTARRATFRQENFRAHIRGRSPGRGAAGNPRARR